MQAIKRYMALAIVFVCIGTGVILLMLDYDTISETWLSVGGAFILIGVGLVLTHVFKSRNLLPE